MLTLRHTLSSLFCCVIVIFAAHAASAQDAQSLEAGAGKENITPPKGAPMAGYYHARAAEGVHDDLYAKAIVLKQGDVKAALVSLDLISTTRPMVEAARKEIERTTGIPGDHVMISATHAHTGPVLKSRGPRDDSLGATSDLIQSYSNELPGKIAKAVEKADKALTPVQLTATKGQEPSIAFNRRFHMIDGTVGWNPGKLNPKIVKPAGPIDPEVGILHFEGLDKAKTPLATYVNYAVHLDNIGGMMFSADVPGVVARLLSEFKGPDMVTLYASGCCGDINHVNVQWDHPQKGFENSARMGTILAASVLRAWPDLEPVELGKLRIKSEIVKLPLPEINAADIEKAREVVALRADPKAKQPTFLESVQAYKVLDVEAREGRPQEVEVQVIVLGQDVAWVSLPGEIFVDLGLAIKQDSPYPNTLIAELANGAIGYIPSRRAYPQGNYEVVSARCAEGSGEMLVAAAVRMLKELHIENAPAKP